MLRMRGVDCILLNAPGAEVLVDVLNKEAITPSLTHTPQILVGNLTPERLLALRIIHLPRHVDARNEIRTIFVHLGAVSSCRTLLGRVKGGGLFRLSILHLWLHFFDE